MKKIMILTIGLFLAFSVFAGASSYRERVDSWTKSSSSSRSIIDDSNNGTTPVGEDDLSVPIGDGLLIMTLLAGGYALVNAKSKINKISK